MRLLDLAPPPGGLPEGVTYIRGSVTSETDVWKLVSGYGEDAAPADVVVHLAGAGMSGRGMLDRELCYRVNVEGARCSRAPAVSPSAPPLGYGWCTCRRTTSASTARW